MRELRPGHILYHRFELLRPIGRGGTGEVWLAFDQELEGVIALKVLHAALAADPQRIEWLKHECRSARRLSHPNIVRVHDFHQDSAGAAISMTCIDGENLAAYQRRCGILTYPEAVAKVIPVASALVHAHARDMVHRDLKPSNILLDRHAQVYLADFGIAAPFREQLDASENHAAGSRYSMSPQQWRGRPPAPADDLYGLGTLLYSLLTGAPPFYPHINAARVAGEIPLSVPDKLGRDDGPETIPPILNQLVSDLLAKSPAERPASAREVLHILSHCVPVDEQSAPAPLQDQGREETASIILPPSDPPPSRQELKPARRRVRGWAAAAALALAVSASLAAGAWFFAYLAEHPLILTDPASRHQPEAARVSPDRKATEMPAVSPVPQLAQAQRTASASPGSPVNPAAEQEPGKGRQSKALEALLESADARRRAGDLAGARAVYQQALEMNPQANAARTALQQIEQRLATLEFQKRMSIALAAMHAGRHAEARQVLLQAQTLRPQAPEVRDALSQVRQQLRTQAIQRLRRQAAAAEEAGKWAAARDAYQAILTKAPHLQLASEGLARSQQHLRVTQLMARYLNHPEHLQSDAGYAEARLLLRQARALRPQPRRLASQIEQIEHHMVTQRTPLPVTLISNEQTDVAIYQVGRLGRFRSRQLKLRPGTYIIVGARDGYKDVRKRIVVKAGADTLRVTVQCEQKV